MLFSHELDSRTEWLSLLKRHRKMLVISLIIAGLLISIADLVWLVTIGGKTTVLECPSQIESKVDATAAAQILVDIRGEVEAPGVYALESTQRLGEAVEKAGGLTKLANAPYVLHALNMAQALEDGQKIYIPHKDEVEYCRPINQFSFEAQTLAGDGGGLISINTASASELDSLAGIGAKRAEDIIANRPYVSLEQLIELKIVSNDIFNEIKTQISL